MADYYANKDENLGQIMRDLPLNSMDLEFKYKPLARLGVIKRFKISRSGIYSCPIKTAMIFTSLNEINKEDRILEIFGNVKTTAELRGIYLQHHPKIPSIYSTNVQILKPWASYFVESDNTIDVVIFKNTIKESTVKPMIWIRFNDRKRKIFDIRMQWGNFFSGKFVLLKLIDCEDQMEE